MYWTMQRNTHIWQTSCVCPGFHGRHMSACFASVVRILLLYNLHHHPSSSTGFCSKMLQQLHHLSVYYLNTCKKICPNFPLCFWSDLSPVSPHSPTEMLVRPQTASVSFRRLLGAAIPPCIVSMPRACASSHPYSTTYLSWPCLFFSLRSFEAPVPNTHRTQVAIHKKHLTLSSFHSQTHNIRLARNRKGWNKETFGVGQWFVIVSVTTVYNSFLLKCLTF